MSASTVVRKEWTGPEQTRLLDLWSRGYSAKQIAKVLGRTQTSVQGKLKHCGAPPKEGRPLIERIKGLCTSEDWAADCWLWVGSMTGSNNKTPVMSVGGRGMNPRRVAMQETGQWRTQWRFCSSTCGEPRCVAPHHGIGRTPSGHIRHQFALGNLGNAKHRAAIARLMRSRSKLTMEDVAQMRQSDESHQEIAERYGMSHQHIQKIRSGQRWVSSDIAQLIG